MSLTGVCYECFIGLYDRSVLHKCFRCLSGVHRQVCFDVLVWLSYLSGFFTIFVSSLEVDAAFTSFFLFSSEESQFAL